MLPESGCCPPIGFAGSMQTSQELSPRSAEPAVLGEPPVGEPTGEAVLHTLKGLSAMTVKQEDEEAQEVPPPAEPGAGTGAASGMDLDGVVPPEASSAPAERRSSGEDADADQLRQLQQKQQLLQHQQQQLQLKQIHRRIQEEQQQLQQQQQQLQQQQLQHSESARGEGGKGRGRRRCRWKLKFHHQALPPEYLDHYEASLASQGPHGTRAASSRAADSGDDKARVIGSRAPRNPDRKRPHQGPASAASTPSSAIVEPSPVTPLPGNLPPIAPKPENGSEEQAPVLERLRAPHGLPAAHPHAFPTPVPIPVPMPFGLEVLTRYQALLGQGKTDLDPAAFVAGNLMNIMGANKDELAVNGAPGGEQRASGGHGNSNRALLSNLLSTRSRLHDAPAQEQTSGAARPGGNKVMSYRDLPYMGEMTLDNIKPRRGRKPKKADICHLIYKNYGTVFPRREDAELPERADRPVATPPAPCPPAPKLSRSDVQNRIISSLLEKRLTSSAQEEAARAAAPQNGSATHRAASEEPLNLCLRDHSPLKIKLLRKHGNFYESNGGPSPVKSEPASPESVVIEVDADPSLVNQEGDDDEDDMEARDVDRTTTPSSEVLPEDAYSSRGDMLYWPGYVHPLLYGKGFPAVQMTPMPQLQVLPPLPPLLRLSNLDEGVPRRESPSPSVSPSQPPSRARGGQGARGSRGAAANRTPLQSPSPGPCPPPAAPGSAPSPPKRKRSAIFIPPVPPESSSSPTTEVSICKFKFTGGAKPSLQEKKMLSVDAGGNFRYYSGTGDKSLRGYEFFPRESMQQHQAAQLQLQQQQAAQQLASKSYQPPHTPPQQDSESLRNLLFRNVIDSLQVPPLPQHQVPYGGVGAGMGVGAGPGDLPWDPRGGPPSLPRARHHPEAAAAAGSRKRKTRKSLEREKLEKTFKEKGFLIQTQQLESAEGATYCKFRQLRKFTRYLFRSWKDYLPGGLAEPGAGPGPGAGPAPGPAPGTDEDPSVVEGVRLEDLDGVGLC